MGLIARVSPLRRRRIDAGVLSGPLARFVAAKRCCVPGCAYSGEAHHVRFRSRGGLDWLFVTSPSSVAPYATDHWLVGNCAPLCVTLGTWPNHHDELHRSEANFEAVYEFSLRERAKEFGELFRRRRPDEYDRILATAHDDPKLRIQWEEAA